jgi:hypothetical protein
VSNEYILGVCGNAADQYDEGHDERNKRKSEEIDKKPFAELGQRMILPEIKLLFAFFVHIPQGDRVKGRIERFLHPLPDTPDLTQCRPLT